MYSMRLNVLALALILLWPVLPLQAAEYLPLDLGNFWNYSTVDGAVERIQISEETTVLGRDVFVIEFIESEENQGLKSFWSTGPDNDTYLHGFWRQSGWGLAYDPPILYLDAPLDLGKTWTTHFDAYSLPDTTYDTSWDATLEVSEAGIYEVGAGSFPGFGIQEVGETRERSAYALDGRLQKNPGRGADAWYSEGVGEIQYDRGPLFTLDSYSGTVASDTETWDGIKALFR